MNATYLSHSLAGVVLAVNMLYTSPSRAEGLEQKIQETKALNLRYEPRVYLTPPLALPTQRPAGSSSSTGKSKGADTLIVLGLASAAAGILLPGESEVCTTGWKCDSGLSSDTKKVLIGGGLFLALLGFYSR